MVMRELIARVPLIPVCLAVLCVFSPKLQARPRLMADEEMDQVCAKGSTGLNVDSLALNQMVFEFSRQTALGRVSGSAVISVEVIPNALGKSPLMLSPAMTVPGGVRSAQARAMAAPAAFDAIDIPPTNIQVMNGRVIVRTDVNINMQTIPSVLRALQQNRLVLPSGFNPLAGYIQGMGVVR